MMRAVVLLSLVASASSFARPALSQRREPGLATSRHGRHHLPRCAPPLASADEMPLVDRGVAAAVYLLPVLDGFVYGSYVYQNVPPIGAAAYMFLPFVNLFNSLPFAGLILFIGLSVFTRNAGLSRFVRFNIQQALLLDIVLIIPGLFETVTRLFPIELQAMGTNFVFYFWVLVVGYAWFNIAQGKTPNAVPIISQAAEMQIGPF